jgi:Ran GTPase-activating protein (RanGAP) involved in mRNA processing and transport
MSVTYFVDPRDRKRSLMMRQKPLCSGAQTGFKCRHYWSTITKLDVLNPLSLRQGEKTRRCLVIAPEIIELGDGGQEQAVFCDRYVADQDRPFDPSFEDFYEPLTQKEIDELDALSDEEADAAAEDDDDDEQIEALVEETQKKAAEIYRRTLTVAQLAGVTPVKNEDNDD